ncbi:MAG: hypothetical protein M3O46_15590 [Myxococcota bacterium]|nr:hypothetical protein [Myxococcota bacterium]
MRLARLAAHLRCLVLLLLAACRSAGRQATPSMGEGGVAAVASASPSAGPLGNTGAAVFSAPIAATRVAGADIVAGLVVSESVVRVVRRPPGGTPWTADVLRGVAWAPDAELRLQPAGDGVAVLWRGLRDARPVRTLTLLGPRGEVRGDSIDIGATFCGTADGLAWIAPRTKEPTRVMARKWSELQPRDVVTLSPDRDPALVCGDHTVIVLGDGDDDVTATTFAPGDVAPRPPIVALRDTDFSDEEREHEAYSIGDDLGLVRVGASGGISMRNVPHGGAPGPWHRLKHRLSADDEVVSVDGDAAATILVVTHEDESACPGAGAATESLRAIRIDRNSGEEMILDLAPADCARSRGPFWIAAFAGAPVIAWVERATTLAPKAAPIAGVAFRILRADGVRAGAIDQQADAIVNAGCDERGCSVAALLREPDSLGMRPATIGVFGYP